MKKREEKRTDEKKQKEKRREQKKRVLILVLSSHIVLKYYKDDARDMTIIQMLRQIDKFVQEWLFGKTYAFLLPTNLQR